MSGDGGFARPQRLAVFEVGEEDGRPLYLLLRTGRSLQSWGPRRADSLDAFGDSPVLYRHDLTMRFGHRNDKLGFEQLRAKVIDRLEREGGFVVNAARRVVYAVDLVEPARDGRQQVYVGETWDLDRRIRQHRDAPDDETPAGRAVRRYGFDGLRTADVRRVPAHAAKEAEAQLSAALAVRGLVVHGDGVRRRPTSARYVDGVSWAALVEGAEHATADEARGPDDVA